MHTYVTLTVVLILVRILMVRLGLREAVAGAAFGGHYHQNDEQAAQAFAHFAALVVLVVLVVAVALIVVVVSTLIVIFGLLVARGS